MRWAQFSVMLGRTPSPFEYQALVGIPGVSLDRKVANKLRVPYNAGWLVGQVLNQFGIPFSVETVGTRPDDADLTLERVPDLRPEMVPLFAEYQREGFRRAMEWCAVLAKWAAGAGKTWLGVAVAAANPYRTLIITAMSVKEQWQAEFERLTTIPANRIQVIYGNSPFVIEERKRPPPDVYWQQADTRLAVDWFRFALGDMEAGARCAEAWKGLGPKFAETVRAPGGLALLLQGWEDAKAEWNERNASRRQKWDAKYERVREGLTKAGERATKALEKHADKPTEKTEAALVKAQKALETARAAAEDPTLGAPPEDTSFPERPAWTFLALLQELGTSAVDAPLADAARLVYQRTGLDADIAGDETNGPARARSRDLFLTQMSAAQVAHVGAYVQWFTALPNLPWIVRSGVTESVVGRFPTETEAQADVDNRMRLGPNTVSNTLLPMGAVGPRVVIVNWDILASWAPVLAAWSPQTVIIDESHRGKEQKGRWVSEEPTMDPKTGIVDTSAKVKFHPGENQSAAAMVVSRRATRVIGLSATPMADGKPRDLWAQLDDLLPHQFGSYRPFTMRYAEGVQGKYAWEDYGESNVPELRGRLSFVMHEVSKAETHKGLPPMKLLPLKIPARELQQVRTSRSERAEAVSRGPSAVRELLLATAATMKNPWLCQRVYDALEAGEKVVVFHGRVAAAEDLGHLITSRVAKAKWHDKAVVHVVYGEESGKPGLKRDVIHQFVHHKGPAVIVCMLQAWGESLDGLQYADRGIFGMLPGTVRQALQGIGRFDRKGWPGPHGTTLPIPSTTVEWPVALGTIDEGILDTVLTKLDITGKILDDGEAVEVAHELRGGRTDEDIVNEMALAMLADADKWVGSDDDDGR